jgi:hypothetical protein
MCWSLCPYELVTQNACSWRTLTMQNSPSPSPSLNMISTWPMTDFPEPTPLSQAASSPTPNMLRVENFPLDAAVTNSMATSEPLVQERDKSIESGFGRPCARSITRVQSYIIPTS